MVLICRSIRSRQHRSVRLIGKQPDKGGRTFWSDLISDKNQEAHGIAHGLLGIVQASTRSSRHYRRLDLGSLARRPGCFLRCMAAATIHPRLVSVWIPMSVAAILPYPGWATIPKAVLAAELRRALYYCADLSIGHLALCVYRLPIEAGPG